MTDADENIDRVLHGLNAAEVPARLEQRVLARVTQRTAENAGAASSRFTNLKVFAGKLSPYAIGAAVVLLLCAVYVGRMSHRASGSPEQTRRDVTDPAMQTLEAGSSAHRVRETAVRRSQKVNLNLATTQTVSADDPDAIALAETLAPSHPTPPMPATTQELVMMRSRPSGHSVEMAELHEAGFRTERERVSIRQYILGLLDPLVTAQNLTPSPPSTDDAQAPPPSADIPSSN
jgi:hypothetical protein